MAKCALEVFVEAIQGLQRAQSPSKSLARTSRKPTHYPCVYVCLCVCVCLLQVMDLELKLSEMQKEVVEGGM